MNDADLDLPRTDEGPEDVAPRGDLPLRHVLDDDARAAVDASLARAAVPDGGTGAAHVRSVPSCADLGALAAERFRCEPLRCTLSALSCGKRSALARTPDPGWFGTNPVIPHASTLAGSPCLRCPIGIENARRAGL